jgi:AcrR family transcriptional regulator
MQRARARQERPRQERAERTRLLIVESAAASFDTVGFAESALLDITRQAGVSKGALYFHFDSKEQLAAAVMAESRVRLREILRAARCPGGSPVQYLMDLCHGVARALEQDVVFRAGLRLTELDGAWIPTPRPAWAALIRRQLDRAAAAEELRPDVPVQQVSSLLAAATSGFEVLGRHDQVWLSRRFLDEMWRAVLPALVRPERVAGLRTEGGRAHPA